jgi:glycosyltransferase involved in cell wall biosynthesis
MKNKKIYLIVQWPVYYHIPLYKILAKKFSNFKVLYLDDIGIKPLVEKEFGAVERTWINNESLEGYDYEFFTNISSVKNQRKFLSIVNLDILKYIFLNRPDVIILHGYSFLTHWLVFFIAKIFKIKIILKGEATNKFINRQSIKLLIKNKILSVFFHYFDVVMYSCSGNKEFWLKHSVDEQKLFSIPCAVDNDFFQSEYVKYLPSKDLIKKELDINNNDMIILFSARFTKRKRPLDLLNALSKIEHKNITILFVGDGPERYEMSTIAKTYNIKTVFTGFVDQDTISKYYSITDISVIISDYDPSPKAMNEAMNFGLPIITTDIVGTSQDLVVNGENGYVIKVGDIDTLAEKIDYLNKNRELISKMGQKSLEIVDEWTFEKGAYFIGKAIKYMYKDKYEFS